MAVALSSVICPELSDEEREQALAMLIGHADVFHLPGELDRFGGSRSNPDPIHGIFPYIKLVEEELRRMLSSKVIEPTTGPWASPVVPVQKKDGSWRFCVDYRRLRLAYPKAERDITDDLPRDSFVAASAHTRDCSASGSCRLDCNTPSTFEHLMDAVMEGIIGEVCLVYLDDIIMFCQMFDHCRDRLGKVSECLTGAGQHANSSRRKRCSLDMWCLEMGHHRPRQD